MAGGFQLDRLHAQRRRRSTPKTIMLLLQRVQCDNDGLLRQAGVQHVAHHLESFVESEQFRDRLHIIRRGCNEMTGHRNVDARRRLTICAEVRTQRENESRASCFWASKTTSGGKQACLNRLRDHHPNVRCFGQRLMADLQLRQLPAFFHGYHNLDLPRTDGP
jgi:hypothetical protein